MRITPAPSRAHVEFPRSHQLAPRPPLPVRPDPALDKPRHFPLSRTTEQVLRMLLEGDLSRMRADNVAESLGISGTTLRRRLRAGRVLSLSNRACPADLLWHDG